MKLSISNIAWSAELDEEMYGFIRQCGFDGLEIAPTRIFPDSPYEDLARARHFSMQFKNDYGLAISSMQSIWYGITESIFGSNAEREKLINYTKKAIDFANAVSCKNLVFGCPTNRNIPNNLNTEECLPTANDFFGKLGDHAASCGTYIAIEPNPPIYSTNFINTTAQAFELCKNIGNPGVKVNIDTGALIYNDDSIQFIKDNIGLVNHVHISEPYLVPIEKRTLHADLLKTLQDTEYNNYISIEMGNANDIDIVKSAILYLRELYDDLFQSLRCTRF